MIFYEFSMIVFFFDLFRIIVDAVQFDGSTFFKQDFKKPETLHLLNFWYFNIYILRIIPDMFSGIRNKSISAGKYVQIITNEWPEPDIELPVLTIELLL